MRPRIALTLSRSDTEIRRQARARYVGALERAGADVIPIEPDDAPPADFDGLCLAGGEDVDPSRYGADNVACEAVDPSRDAVEFALVQRALDRDVPILAICRGFQVLNVALGGTLVQHRDGHRPLRDEVVAHVVVAEPGSLLERSTAPGPQQVNSRHHQVVTASELAPGVRVAARAGDVIEAIELPGRTWVLGVQWHPERTNEVAPAEARIFDAFTAAARVPITQA